MVKQLCSKYLLDVTPIMHEIHRLSIFSAIESNINGGVLSISRLGITKAEDSGEILEFVGSEPVTNVALN